jgi:hypothetical protein
MDVDCGVHQGKAAAVHRPERRVVDPAIYHDGIGCRHVLRDCDLLAGDRQYASRWTFYIGKDGKILYIDKVDSPRSVGVMSKVGQRNPVYCTSLGKTLLAFQPEERQKRILEAIGGRVYKRYRIYERAI